MARAEKKRGREKEKDRPENLFVKGARLRVLSLGAREQALETEGEFLSFTAIGYAGAEGLVMLVQEGKKEAKRIIPVNNVLKVDVLREAPEEEAGEEEAHAPYYT